MTEDWGGWNPHRDERRRAVAAMSPTQRIEWLEATLLLWGTERLLAERARRRAEAESRWHSMGPSDRRS